MTICKGCIFIDVDHVHGLLIKILMLPTISCAISCAITIVLIIIIIIIICLTIHMTTSSK